MSVATTERKKPLGVRATPEQHRVIAEAAVREHRSINSFVLRAALDAARAAHATKADQPRPRRTQEEVEAAVSRAQALMRKYRQPGRSLVDELISERRAEAARE